MKKPFKLLNIFGDNISFNDIKSSTLNVNITKAFINIWRKKFKVSDEWFESLLAKTYDDELRSKYIPELHQNNFFEDRELVDLLQFDRFIGSYKQQVEVCQDYINRFTKDLEEFHDALKNESITIIKEDFKPLVQAYLLRDNLQQLGEDLKKLKVTFQADGYNILSAKNDLIELNINFRKPTSFRSHEWTDFLDKKPINDHILRYLFQHLNQVYLEIDTLNRMLQKFKLNTKIIAGIAGSGKTHYSAHIIKSLSAKKDYVLFFKSKLFNGDDINLESRMLQLLEVPTGYSINEIFDKINNYCKKKNKRCLIIIDALNETTKSNIGFSKIWKNHLDVLINQIKAFSHIYFVCTLRTSYINNIWLTPPNITEIKGFETNGVTIKACEKYFNYYKILIDNWDTADFSFFRNPLLLDLFCKLTNDQKTIEKRINLNIDSYLKIFQDYIEELILEVQNRLDLQSQTPILDGFSNSSSKFLDNNEAILFIDDFSAAFDQSVYQTRDTSIARAVLDGYHIFIKDIIKRRQEIVKHSQQEIGGYLLAKSMSDRYGDVNQLVSSALFQEKIIGSDPDLHHQLRLDILKFLIAIRPEIIRHSTHPDIVTLAWWYLFNVDSPLIDTTLPEYLIPLNESREIIEEIFTYSYFHWLSDVRPNFEVIATLLQTLPLWEYELTWTYFIYKNADDFNELIDKFIDELKDGYGGFSHSDSIVKFVAFILSTTVRELRDKATIYFIELGKADPLRLLNVCIDSAKIKDIYIYERLVSCCYGVAMIKQNDEHFVAEILPQYAQKLFDLQFSTDSLNSVYNYIVTDSIRHIIDLALLNEVIEFNADELEQIKNYRFKLPYEWSQPTEQQQELIDNSGEMSRPDPINMDFGIYTIPRLTKRDEIDKEVSIANVYKRIVELGYEEIDLRESHDENFKSYFWGHKVYGIDGKSDRLGKKYCWVAFFDYAGYLLSHNQLDVFYGGDNSIEPHYDRLNDVDIDISMPARNYELNLRIYEDKLFDKIEENPKWFEEIKIDSVEQLFNYDFDGDNYTMLYGFIEQRLNKDSYDVRSFLMIESVLVDKDEITQLKDIKHLRNNWNGDIHSTSPYLYQVYFGELYWADSVPILKRNDVYIPISVRKETITLSSEDILLYDEYRNNVIGDVVEREILGNRGVSSEPTLMEYRWESDSKTLKGFGEFIPSSNIGRYLNLKVDPATTQILDSELNPAYKCIIHEDNKEYFKNNFNYLRKDLLKKYLEDNNLVVLYQVKQHSYDKSLKHNRAMKYFIK